MRKDNLNRVEKKYAYPQNPFFETLAVGSFSPAQVVVETQLPTSKPTPFKEAILEHWGRKDNNPRGLRRTLTLQTQPIIKNNQLHLATAESTFLEFDATRDPEVRKSYSDSVHTVDPLGTSVLLITEDEKLLLVQRPHNAATKPDAMSVISGYPEVAGDPTRIGKIPDADESGNWNPFQTIIRELAEETGIYKSELSSNDFVLTGIIFNKSSNQPVVTFAAKTFLTAEHIKERELVGKTDGEVRVRFIPNTYTAIEDMLLTFAASSSPSGIASLLFYGRQQFGDEWYKKINSRLTEEHQKHMQRTAERRRKFERQGIIYFLNNSF